MQISRWMIMAALAAAPVAGCTSGLGDGEHDVALPNGKADSTYSECELDAVVAWLNEDTTDAASLKAAGVHGAASNRIPDHRPFSDIEAVDAVPFVGASALEQLVAAVRDQDACTTDPAPAPESELQIEVIMSPQDYDDSHLQRVAALIRGAQRSVDIAMYSFSDNKIVAAIEDAVKRGVSVRAVLEAARGDARSPAGTLSAQLENLGVDVRYVNKIMHHKFAIIDGPRSSLAEAAGGTLVSGSGNWSHSAGTRYDENTMVIRGSRELVLRFQQEFNLLWNNSRDLVANDELEYFESMAIADADIEDDPTVGTAFTSANFRTYSSSAHGNTFSTIRGLDTVADQWVELISKAERSIHIASGHLRSRPIAEAVMRRMEERPDLDVRILLDGQEYISEWYHQNQLRDLDGCVDNATSESRRQDCYDRGFYFSYQVGEESPAQVRYKHYSYRWHYSTAVQMHHKYMVVDGRHLITGSYNLSDNAEHNTLENVMILDGNVHEEAVAAYEANFESLWRLNRDEMNSMYEDLLADVNEGTDPFPIVFTSMSLEWDEIEVLKKAMRDHCPDINSEEFRNNPGQHHACYP